MRLRQSEGKSRVQRVHKGAGRTVSCLFRMAILHTICTIGSDVLFACGIAILIVEAYVSSVPDWDVWVSSLWHE